MKRAKQRWRYHRSITIVPEFWNILKGPTVDYDVIEDQLLQKMIQELTRFIDDEILDELQKIA